MNKNLLLQTLCVWSICTTNKKVRMGALCMYVQPKHEKTNINLKNTQSKHTTHSKSIHEKLESNKTLTLYMVTEKEREKKNGKREEGRKITEIRKSDQEEQEEIYKEQGKRDKEKLER